MKLVTPIQMLVWDKKLCKVGSRYQCPRCYAEVVIVESQEFNDPYMLTKNDSAIDMGVPT